MGEHSAGQQRGHAGRPVPAVAGLARSPHARRLLGGPVAGYSPWRLTTQVRKTGAAPSTWGADPIGHMLYLELDRPKIARNARWYLEPVDYVSMCFTGTVAASPVSMTAAWLIDNWTGWAPTLA